MMQQKKLMKSHFMIILIVLFLMNIINFMDRGIIPGASEEFNQFISRNGFRKNQDVYLGMLQSAFIIGYAIASVGFGHACHYYPPFYLCTFGMVIWIAAVSFSGLAYYTHSYTFLFITRMISGVGEAAFQTSIPPWISKYAPISNRGAYLSLFFTAIPTGTALGYAYSAAIATSIGWQYCFFIEAIAMACFIPYILYIAPYFPCDTLASTSSSSSSLHSRININNSTTHDNFITNSHVSDDDITSPRSSSSSSSSSLHKTDNNHHFNHLPTIKDEIYILLKNPIYLCVVAGYAAQTGSLMGLSTFGSSFLIGLGFFNTETQSSSIFGLIVSVAGVLATPLGGFLTDWLTLSRKRCFEKKFKDGGKLTKLMSERIELQTTLSVITMVNCIGGIFLCLAYFIHNKTSFLLDLFIGAFFILLSGASINLAVMVAVPETHRNIAFGMSCMGLHLFGDVPSPILAGLLKDKLAPHCTSQSSSSDECRNENHGLRITMLIMSSWTFLCVFYMFIAYLIASYSSSSSSSSSLSAYRNNGILSGYIDSSGNDDANESSHSFDVVSVMNAELGVNDDEINNNNDDDDENVTLLRL